ncbi:hypothetical protein IWQ62_005521 [Dispira parvispora]|uniref:t-SNARE coiled-coil homology domain-containing protein n=1 Tax=Dispira parvispora TaxID=1520584 RepID=A0A9W8E0Y7_9FUNG|nr:hypothetical protein IWQ62_005521 [Dispira parvispora]
MSFNDLGGYGSSSPRSATLDHDEREYRALVQRVSQNVFRVNTNVSNMQRLVVQLSRNQDNQQTRQRLHDITEQTRDLAKTTGHDLKELDTYQQNVDDSTTHARKMEQQKLTKDFQKVLGQFQVVQRDAAEKSREFVDRAKHTVETLQANAASDEHELDQVDQQQSLLHHQERRQDMQVLDNEIEFNEMLIAEREHEIYEIEQGITELNEVFRDLGTIVNEQQSLLDNIESNVSSMAINVRHAGEELITANRHQKKSRRTMCFLLLLLVAIVCIVLLVALS